LFGDDGGNKELSGIGELLCSLNIRVSQMLLSVRFSSSSVTIIIETDGKITRLKQGGQNCLVLVQFTSS